MGVNVEDIHPEEIAGQWEMTTEPQYGVQAADDAFYVKNATKAFFKARGYNATFMTW